MSARAKDKAIIVAAGRGRRLGDKTDELPKCMVEVAGKPILHRQLEALAAHGVEEIVIVRGYLGDRIDPGRFRVRFVENPAWERNNILASLLYAQGEMSGGFYFSYSDIVFAPSVVGALVAAAERGGADVSLVVDRLWHEAYVDRTLHPLPEAELARVEPDGRGPRITRVGKQAVPAEAAAGEFIGLAHFSDAAGVALREVWSAALAGGGLDAPFGRAAALRNAYLTDALNALADGGRRLEPVFIDGKWREIDTQQDHERAAPLVDRWP
jgi:L-glutamine-phosphate cytidylyltransferase